MQRRFLDTHLTSECSERVVQCVYCKDEFAFWRLEVSLSRYIKGLGWIRDITCVSIIFKCDLCLYPERYSLWPIMGAEAPQEEVPETFFRHQVYERVGISRVEIYERVGKSVISVGNEPKRDNMHFVALKSQENVLLL